MRKEITVAGLLVTTFVLGCSSREPAPNDSMRSEPERTAVANAEEAANPSDPSASVDLEEPVRPSVPSPVDAVARRCAVDESTRSIRLWAQGGHAEAVNDQRIELSTRRLSGQGFRLEGSQPIGVPVDRVLGEEELEPLLTLLRSTCGAVELLMEDRHAAPGGMSRIEVLDADSRMLVLASGAASSVKEGEAVLEVETEPYQEITQMWPKGG